MSSPQKIHRVRRNRFFIPSVLTALLFVFAAHSLKAQGNVEASLVPELLSVEPGKTQRIGLHLKMKPGWHTYWHNPGDSGLETRISWILPDGFHASPIRFPVPHMVSNSGLINFAYEDETFLITELSVPAIARPGTAVRVFAKVDWLECADVCIPGKAELAATFRIEGVTQSNVSARALFENSDAGYPFTTDRWKVRASRFGKDLILIAEPANGKIPKGSSFSFFPWDGELIQTGQEVIEQNEKRVKIRLHPDAGHKDIHVLRGALFSPGGFDGSLGPDAKKHSAIWVETEVGSGGESGGMALWLVLLYAFLGGLILNLMPCVFPVLSIKIVGFVRNAAGDAGLIRKQGWVYFAGVVGSFLAIAAVLMTLRSGGEALGWGFQLQSPLFVGFLIYLIFLVGLNLMGVFEFGGFSNVGGELVYQKGVSGAFWSGVLAVLIASPCTGPFMGAALGFALAQPPAIGLLVFLFLGIGMGLPYLLLSYKQNWLKKLPKPGEWMNVFKQVMSFPMFATAIWLIWVYGKQTGTDAVVLMLFGLMIVSVLAWIWGRWNLPHKSSTIRTVARLAMLFLAGLAVYTAVFAASQKKEVMGMRHGEASGIPWETYAPDRVKALEKEGKPYFIDFTAAWCLTCQVNKKTSLSSDKVKNALREKGIVPLLADWTDYNPVISEALAKYGRSGIPVYVFYDGTPGGEGALLPEVLTEKIVLDAFESVYRKQK